MTSENEKLCPSGSTYSENTDHQITCSLSKFTTIAEKQLLGLDVFGKDFDERPTLVPIQRITPSLDVGETVFPSNMYTAKSYPSISASSTFERNPVDTMEVTTVPTTEGQSQFPQNNSVCQNESCTQHHGQQDINPAMLQSSYEQTDPLSTGSNNSAASLQVPSASTASKELFYCDFCNKRFTHKYILETHRRTHTGERPFRCSVCPKQFARRDTLQIHRRTHTGEKPFQCEFCLKQFAQKHYLQIHRRIHTGEKLFHCDVYFKQFTQRDYLEIHKRSHTGEKPFQCDFCIQKFARRDTLQIHRRIHTGEKPFHCDICQKQFAQRDKLHTHRRTHSRRKSFQCNVCLKQFAHRDYLQIHARSHTGEKPFQCDFCIQKFARKDTLQIHRRIHTGEKPFHCEICGKKFAQTDKLRRHKRTHPELAKKDGKTTAGNKKLLTSAPAKNSSDYSSNNYLCVL